MIMPLKQTIGVQILGIRFGKGFGKVGLTQAYSSSWDVSRGALFPRVIPSLEVQFCKDMTEEDVKFLVCYFPVLVG